MVGRARELAALVDSVTCPGGNGAVVSGPAGVGKSALVRAACEHLLARHAEPTGPTGALTVQQVRATRAVATIPFGAFARFVPAPASGGMPVHQLEALARLTGELLATAGEGRLLLGVDDAHLLDDGSAALVHSLVEAGAAVLVTVRTGEPLADALGALRKDLGVRHVELGPLDRTALDELARAELASTGASGGTSRLDPDLGRRLWALSGGHPLFARELLRSGRQQQVIVERDGRWVWSGPMPRCEVLHDVLRQHLDDAGPQVREVVEIVALGEPLSLGALAQLAPVEDVGRAEQVGLVTIDAGSCLGSPTAAGPTSAAEGDSVRLAHPLYGELVRQEMGRARAMVLASALARAVGAVDGKREVLRVASWQLQGEPAAADPELLFRAAQRASAMGEPETAVRFVTAAIDRGAGAEAAPLLADALYYAGRYDEVAPVFGRFTLDPAVPSPIRRLVTMSQASAQFWGRGEYAPALATLEQGLDGLDRADQHEVEAHHASICFFAGAVGETIVRLERLLADDELSPAARIRAATLASLGLALAGRVDDALRLADESAALCLTTTGVEGLAGFLGGAFLSKATALITAGRLAEAEQVVRALTRMAGDQRQALFVGPLHLMLGRILLLRGRIDEADAELAIANDSVGVDAARVLGWTRAMRAKALAQSDQPARADAALAAVEEVRHPAAGLFELDVALAEAWSHHAAGRRSKARQAARSVALRAQSNGVFVVAAEAWHDLARLGDARAALVPLRRLAMAIEGPLVSAWAEHAAALAAGDGASLDRAAAQLEAVGLMLHAAEAASEAALAHQRTGRRGSALGSLATARRLRDECPGAAAAHVELGMSLHDLTEREREIAELAARGQTNRQIADQLFLSVRTVNNHLNHVYTKLGFSDREQLATALDFAC
jgi:DNA-binding NarL/FixJ family response regulator